MPIEDAPDDQVLAAFGLSGEPVILEGGMAPVYLVNDTVLKRVDSVDEAVWRSELFLRLDEKGFRLPAPVPTVAGAWIADGWVASRHLVGRHDASRWPQLVTASRAFHAALSRESRPAFLDQVDHRWARAHRVAWGEAEIEMPEDVARRVYALRAMAVPVTEVSQLIHTDLAGNVLFAGDEPPGILDFSPWWAPVGYAEGILMTDALLWYGADSSVVSLVSDRASFPQMLVRACIFRLVALSEGIQKGHVDYRSELGLFDSLSEFVSTLL